VPTPPNGVSANTTASRIWRTSLRLLLWLVALALLVIPIIRAMPLGDTTTVGIFAWLLVGVALYWLFTDLGYRPLLLMQLFLFSAAVACLSAKVFLVSIGVLRLSILRRTAVWLILFGAICATLNVLLMLLNLFRPPPPESPTA
jgi:hypothetical protein